MFKKMFFLGTVLALGGCASAPPLNFTAKEPITPASRINAELKSISVTVAQASEAQGKMRFNLGYSETIPALWKTSLEDSINRSLIFSDSSTNKVNVRATILEFYPPLMGASMTTFTTAKYEVQDRADGKVLFSETIRADGHVPAGYAFLGSTRVMESINRSVSSNITEFLKRLDSKGQSFYVK